MSAGASYPVVPPGVGDFRGAGGGEPAAHWKATASGERLVPTHCSFCGVQCGHGSGALVNGPVSVVG